jgi:uncharacterized protein YndB with AHSA1/START domain
LKKDLAFRMQIFIEAPPEDVWHALTDPETSGLWWDPIRQADWRPGGRVVYEPGDGSTIDAEVLEVDPPRRLSFTFDARAFPDHPPTRVTWEIEPVEGGCLLRLVHDGFAETGLGLSEVCKHWPTMLATLKRLLEARKALPGDAYDWTSFRIHHYYAAPADAVFRAVATASGLERWFLADASFRTRDGAPRAPDEVVAAGDSYRWRWIHPATLEGEVLACEPGSHAAFTFGSMRVDLRVESVDDRTRLTLRQTDCRNDPEGRVWNHLNCRCCWAHFLTNLKAVLEHGIDLRERSRPDRADCTSVGYEPAS